MQTTYYLLITIMIALSLNTNAQTFKNVEGVRCYDGDTCTVNIKEVSPIFGEALPIRLLGIDTAEIRGTKGSAHKCALKAKYLANEMLNNAKNIELRSCTRGKYFRLVCDIITDGKSISKAELKHGYALPYDGGKKPKGSRCS